MQSLSHVSNEELLERLHALVGSQRRMTAQIVAHIGEMDTRYLYAEKGFSSLFAYCVQQLGFSEDEACRRIEAARLMRRFPSIYAHLEKGALTLTVLGLLKPHLTDENQEDLFAGVSGANVRRAKEWLAERFPQPDVPSAIRKLPERAVSSPLLTSTLQSASVPMPKRKECDGADRSAVATDSMNGSSSNIAGAGILDSNAAAPASTASTRITEGSALPRQGQARSVRVEPLSRDRFLVKLTADRSLKDKLELARDLMLHKNPSGDLAVVIERGLDLLIADIKRTKFAESARPRNKRPKSRRRYVDAATRRGVTARDGMQCSFIAADGKRCESRAFLEFDHRTPAGCGGESQTQNVRILCRAHNLLAARDVYGSARVNQAVSARRKKKGSLRLRDVHCTPRYGIARARGASGPSC
jgi:hypothetical protein